MLLLRKRRFYFVKKRKIGIIVHQGIAHVLDTVLVPVAVLVPDVTLHVHGIVHVPLSVTVILTIEMANAAMLVAVLIILLRIAFTSILINALHTFLRLVLEHFTDLMLKITRLFLLMFILTGLILFTIHSNPVPIETLLINCTWPLNSITLFSKGILPVPTIL